jgi:hypothetical protein
VVEFVRDTRLVPVRRRKVLMSCPCAGLRPITGTQAAMNMAPAVGRDVGGIDAKGFGDLDRLEHPRPSGTVQQTVAAGVHVRNGDVALAGADGAEDVDPRLHTG